MGTRARLHRVFQNKAHAAIKFPKIEAMTVMITYMRATNDAGCVEFSPAYAGDMTCGILNERHTVKRDNAIKRAQEEVQLVTA